MCLPSGDNGNPFPLRHTRVGSVVLRPQTGKVTCVVIVMVNIFTNQINVGTGVKQC